MPRHPAVRWLFAVTAVFTFLAVALGSVVCATDSSAACPNWPGCYVGKLTPDAHLNPVLEFVHRVVAVSVGPLLLACGVVALRARPRIFRVLPWIGLAGALVAGVLGMLTIKRGIGKGLAAFDLGSSLLALVAITLAAVMVWRGSSRLRLSPTARWAWGALGLLLVFHVTSIFVAGPGSLTRCLSWPVWRWVAADGAHTPQAVRLAVGALAIAAAVVASLNASRWQGARGVALAALALMLVEVVLSVVVGNGAGLGLKAFYAATAGAIFALIGWMATLATVEKPQ